LVEVFTNRIGNGFIFTFVDGVWPAVGGLNESFPDDLPLRAPELPEPEWPDLPLTDG
jgi:hypothetical protein